jgi:protocatechuate 3,4-dioxygenase beta subunit
LSGRVYPRLAGVLRTDSLGRYRVLSILPGQYAGPPHIHFEAWGPDLPASSWFVNLYRGPDEKGTPAWRRMDSSHTLDRNRPETYFTRDARGVFHAHYDLRWDRAFRMPEQVDAARRGLLMPERADTARGGRPPR